MHRPLTAALAAALGLLLAQPPPAPAGPPVEEAQRRLDRDDARGAVSVLETALPGVSDADRPALLDLLRRAYAAAARQAEADGRSAEAESYRENLDILDRRPRDHPPTPAPAPVPTPTPAPRPAPRAVKEPPAAEVRVTVLPPTDRRDEPPAKPVAPEPTPAARPDPAEVPLPRGRAETKDEPQAISNLPELPTPTRAVPVSERSAPGREASREADEAFVAGRYAEAGRIYAALDRARKLPPERRDHWAYCRAVEVVNRINARPATPREWAAIDAEIQAIRALSPSLWFSEYLRNLAAERNRPTRPRTARSGKLVVRGSSPDEPDAAPRTPPAPPPSRVAWSGQPVTSPNFVVRHVEEHRALAEQVARAAEAAREAQMKRWGAAAAAAGWDPRCEIVLFPNAQDFSRETSQPPDSPGFSTMSMNEGRIVLRRVHLRADHPNLVRAILPHEVTHVVLADLFPHQQIPRWADEGMAVLAEPATEQSLRAADLDSPLRAGRLFKVSDLVVMDYPAPEHWGLYYAQSVSLTRYLVESGSPAQFVRLVQSAQKASVIHLFGKVDTSLPPDHPRVRGQLQEALRLGFADALKEVYGLSGYDDLQARWLSYARTHTADPSAATAASADAGTKPGAARR